MKAPACALSLAALLVAAPAGAQPTAVEGEHAAAAEAAIPDVPQGPASLRGRVVAADGPAADVEVLLYALPSAGTPGLRRTRTDAEGRFAFESISDAPTTAYLVGARYGGVPFPGARVQFGPGQLEREVSLRVGPTTADPGAVRVERAEIRLRWVGGRLAVTENHALHNAGAETYYVVPDQRPGARPAFRTELPEGAQGFATPLGIAPEGLVRRDRALRFYGPVFPSAWDEPGAGRQDFAFQYGVPAQGERLELARRFPDGADEVVVIAPEGTPLEVTGAGDPEATVVDGRPAVRWTRTGVGAGDALTLALEVPSARADRDAVRVPELRVFLELDDAALQVQEQYVLEVSGESSVVGEAGEPLLRVALPEGARDVRFDRGAFALGLEAEDGGVALAGPLPPGETRFEIAYRLPAGETTRFEKEVDRALPLLSIYVADTGLVLESDRLHRRRPVRTPDRLYLHMEAFQVEPGETVALALTPIRASSSLPRAVRLGAVALAAALAAAFLFGPLRAEDARPDRPVSEERRERDALYVALRDLEHDYETGKVADADYERMRLELRGRALALLREEERSRGTARDAAPTPAGTCADCGAALRPDDRFCAQCGTPAGVPLDRPA